MYYHKNVYFSDKTHNPDKILKHLNHGKMVGFHTAVLFVNKGEHLEVFDTALLVQKYMRKLDIEIVALVASRDEAIDYITKIARISIDKYGEFMAKKCIDEMNERDLVG